MPRRRSEDLEEDDEEDDPDEEESPPPRPRRRARPPHGGRLSAEDEAENDEDEVPPGTPMTRGWFGPKRPIYWRARDSLWFEPLVALAIVVLLLVGLFAYTQNWPPIYVVESDSMQHGLTDQVGLINTGDLVLAQKIDPNSIVPYVVGMQTGYSTYGEYGDVILYHPFGETGVTPVIHRAIVFLTRNAGNTWSVPELSPLPCSISDHPYYFVTLPSGGGTCSWNDITGTLTLYGIGWQSATVQIPLGSMGSVSGFVTMGDNNYLPGGPGTASQGEIDQTFGISDLVQTGWIVGVARGMIPWFGSLKLLLEGDSSMVPVQSWGYMGITFAAVILAGLGIHLLLRRRGEGPSTGSEEGGSWIARLVHRRKPEDEEGPPEPARVRHRSVSKEELLRRAKAAKRGRPRPAVRRTSGRKRGSEETESEDL
jgi:signal peptidase